MIIDYVYVCSFGPIETFKRTIRLPVFVLFKYDSNMKNVGKLNMMYDCQLDGQFHPSVNAEENTRLNVEFD